MPAYSLTQCPDFEKDSCLDLASLDQLEAARATSLARALKAFRSNDGRFHFSPGKALRWKALFDAGFEFRDNRYYIQGKPVKFHRPQAIAAAREICKWKCL